MTEQTYKEATAAIKESGIALPLQKVIQKALDKDFNQGNWIPCSERTPNNGEVVLCTDGRCIYIVEYDANWDVPFCDIDNITAWQQLPEPYKESCTGATKEEYR